MRADSKRSSLYENAIKKRRLGYGSVEAKMYERCRRSSLADVLFWEAERQELLYAVNRLNFSTGNVLDAGCGTGRFMPDLAERGYVVHGLDSSQYMLSVAYEKLGKSPYFNFCRADLFHIPFRDNTFVFVYCIRVMNQLPSKEYALKALHELCRVCKNQGLILVEYVNERGLSRFSRTGHSLPPVNISICDFKRTLYQDASRNYKICYLHGILFFSKSLWNILPLPFLRLVEKLDKLFCKFFPEFATRCYVLIFKEKNCKK